MQNYKYLYGYELTFLEAFERSTVPYLNEVRMTHSICSVINQTNAGEKIISVFIKHLKNQSELSKFLPVNFFPL